MKANLPMQPLAIKKLQLQTTVSFAIEHVPHVHQATLEQLMALVYTDGTHGKISHPQLLAKMRLVLQYLPEACPRSLAILIDLLELPRSGSLTLLPSPDQASSRTMDEQPAAWPTATAEIISFR
jgi:hypothetical protein